MISVIIPLYNKEISISATIKSVLSQTFQNFEIIVVNDGSSDKSLESVSSIIDSRITIINQENKGVSTARNIGIRQSKYFYIALLDADDIWDPDFLKEMQYFIRSYPEASLYGCGYSFQNLNSEIFTPNLGLSKEYKGYLDYFDHAKYNTLFTSSSVVFRKADFIEIGEYDSHLIRGEDIDLWIRFALFKKVAFYNKPLAIYKLHAENRALNRPVSKEKCLVGNLTRYNQYELTNPIFKEFLDDWRLAHVHNFLTGKSTEVTEIKSLLYDIDLKNRSILWYILKFSPKGIQAFIYRSWIAIKSKMIKKR
jgi:glycosyltransferase involved in cell wall biosynthesis